MKTKRRGVALSMERLARLVRRNTEAADFVRRLAKQGVTFTSLRHWWAWQEADSVFDGWRTKDMYWQLREDKMRGCDQGVTMVTGSGHVVIDIDLAQVAKDRMSSKGTSRLLVSNTVKLAGVEGVADGTKLQVLMYEKT